MESALNDLAKKLLRLRSLSELSLRVTNAVEQGKRTVRERGTWPMMNPDWLRERIRMCCAKHGSVQRRTTCPHQWNISGHF
jgi:hypothetical protein